MNDTRTQLENRKQVLIRYRMDAVKRLEKLKYKGEPEYHVCVDSKKQQYFLRNGSDAGKGKYLQAGQLKIARQVATYEYLIKIIKLIDNEIKHIDTFLRTCGNAAPEAYYGSLSKGRQNLIEPIELTDEQYIDEWLKEPFEGSGVPFGISEFYTDRGERVRSKSEILIANALARNNVPYKYEYPLYLDELGLIHPDFTALNIKKRKQVYWEHLGMMDDPGYARDNTYRINVYEKNGIFKGENLIVTWETSTLPLDVKLIDRLIRHYLIE